VSLYREWSLRNQQAGVKFIGCHIKLCSENEIVFIHDVPYIERERSRAPSVQTMQLLIVYLRNIDIGHFVSRLD
jgi:hypothetical protein